MLRYILWALLAYFIYRFVVGFLIPVFIASRRLRRQIKTFNANVQQQQEQAQQHFQQQQAGGATQQKTAPQQEKAGDYIEFEEVK